MIYSHFSDMTSCGSNFLKLKRKDINIFILIITCKIHFKDKKDAQKCKLYNSVNFFCKLAKIYENGLFRDFVFNR